VSERTAGRRVPRERERFSPKETLLAALFLAPSFVVFVAFAFVPFWRVVSWGTFETVGRMKRFLIVRSLHPRAAAREPESSVARTATSNPYLG
jgi:predicted exporter